MTFEYKTIEKPIENTLLKEKGSKFIGFAYPVNNESELKNALEKVREEHPKATHHCYAFRMGLNGKTIEPMTMENLQEVPATHLQSIISQRNHQCLSYFCTLLRRN
jgi:putative IMPACT (imprinted ancient) family translation regulator